MQLIPDSVVCFPNLGKEDASIYVPEMTVTDRTYFQNYSEPHHDYWGSRSNDYFWSSYWLDWWYKKRQKEKMKLLDLGCGNSLWPYYVKEKYPNSHVLGVDVPKYKTMATKKVTTFDLDLGGVDNFEFPPNKFDVVSSISALEHFDVDVKMLMSKITRTLSRDGLFLLTTDFWFEDKDKILPGACQFGWNGLTTTFNLTESDKQQINKIVPNPRRNYPYLLFLGFIATNV